MSRPVMSCIGRRADVQFDEVPLPTTGGGTTAGGSRPPTAYRRVHSAAGLSDREVTMTRSNDENTVVVSKEPTAATQFLLGLMRTGATDRAIARELGVSLRTLHRRIARLQSLLGVQSRFQLGVLAAELEWLAESPPSQAVSE